MTKRFLEETLRACEADIRQGQAHRMSARLASIQLARLPREFRLPLANLCRRASLLNLGLKILAPVVRGEGRVSPRPTGREQAEYAVLLQRAGSVGEALTLLRAVNPSEVPEAALYQAFCHFNRWEYQDALAPLTRYLEGELAPYPRLVARVNLAASLLACGRVGEAKVLLARNIEDARAQEARRLEANCWEMLAQTDLAVNRGREARVALTTARGLLGEERTLDELFVSKWEAILDALESQDVGPVLEFRSRALRFGDHESVRDADLYALKVDFNESAFRYLCFGTPFAGYRERIERELAKAAPSDTYLLGAPAPERVLDLARGAFQNGEIASGLDGKKTHQLLGILLKDFYRPRGLGGLFAELFPNEYFDVDSSPSRVYQVIRRARAWLKVEKIPARIEEEAGAYRLALGQGSFAFAITLERATPDANEVLWRRLMDALGDRPELSSSEIGETLSLSATSCRRFLAWALESGRVIKSGRSVATAYRLVQVLDSAA